MLRKNLSLRVVTPTILVSTLLLALCLTAALTLYRQPTASARTLGDDVNAAWAAHDLEITLKDLRALLRQGNEQVDALHESVREQLVQIRSLANTPEERALIGRLEDVFARYLEDWGIRRAANQRREADPVQAAVRTLEGDVWPLCDDLQQVNAREIRQSEADHQQTVRRVLVGLILVGGVGALAGLALGYGVARGLRRSIYQLSVRIRDAADKLGQDLPTVVLTEDGDLQHLHQQMQGVVREIEQVVERLQQREREVLRAEQLAAVGQLAAGVAHELRNPLTSVKLLVQTNREEAESQALPAEDLQVIEREIRRMERSLQTFLDFARQPKPERRPLELAQLVERTAALVGGRARKQHVTLQLTRPPAPVVVDADTDQIQQLLVNLALNALDVMPRGGTLEMAFGPPERGYAELCVRDTGPGIAPELLPRLFQPFVSGKETGLGLGLVISQRIAESHGGSLRAANRPEGGACFSLRLPVLAAAAVS
jgi:signal transduction histidine kinase